jgi:hypothetical protein
VSDAIRGYVLLVVTHYHMPDVLWCRLVAKAVLSSLCVVVYVVVGRPREGTLRLLPAGLCIGTRNQSHPDKDFLGRANPLIGRPMIQGSMSSLS